MNDCKVKKMLEQMAEEKRKHRQPKSWDEKWIDMNSGTIRIILDNNVYFRTIFQDFKKPISFKELFDLFGIKREEYRVFYVWFEMATIGEIWQYGNYPECEEWLFHGETNGYA